MMEYTIEQLELWNNKIEEIVNYVGLNCYPQEFEICNYEDMICYEAYVGMPSHYPHWSLGKAYERKKIKYKLNLEGLPYEMVINSSPCIAYLMKDNSLLLQILTIAHVYGHNDFFKNNRLFVESTRANDTLEMFKLHADRIRSYVQDPSIGYERVEKILDAAHALKLQISRVTGTIELTHEEKSKKILDDYRKKSKGNVKGIPDLNRIPLEPTDNLISFLIEYANLEEYEKDILNIVMEETKYFIPQIETKIMNEGWASYWHYNILNKLNLSQSLHLEFINRHNQVIRPLLGMINPYYMGYKILNDIEKRYGKEKIFEVRKLERDESFIRKYLTEELCLEMNLFQYSKHDKDYVIDEISDEEGWKKIRNTIANSVGMGSVPLIKVMEVLDHNNSLVLEHEYDGRDLQLKYAYETLKHVSTLWKGQVILNTVIKNKKKKIICDKNKKISLMNF